MRPAAQSACRGGRLRGDSWADEVGDGVGEGPQLGAVYGHVAVVADLLTVEQPADDVDALPQALVPDGLAGPAGAGHALVARLAGAERRPEATGEHLAEGGHRLGDYHGVVALAGGVDDAEG